jgi:hypothetical protein
MECNLSQKSLVVEFVGLPASGKSTIYDHVKASLIKEGLLGSSEDLRPVKKTKRIKRTISNYVSLFVDNPRYFVQATSLIIGSRQKSRFDLKMAWQEWLDTTAFFNYYVKKCSGIHLMDQGVFQALWQIGFASEARNIREIIKNVYCNFDVPTVIIFVEASPQTIERRISKRSPHSRLDRRLPTNPSLVYKAEELYQQTKSILLEPRPPFSLVKSLVINNDSDTDMEWKADQVGKFLNYEWKHLTASKES